MCLHPIQGAGVDKSKPVIVYCQSGIRAVSSPQTHHQGNTHRVYAVGADACMAPHTQQAYAFMAIIELGYSVALYDASMGEWLNDPNLPVEQS